MFDIEGQEAMYDGMLIDPTIVINGKNGRDGVDGKDGAPGPEGMPGRDGVDGRDGKDGKDGRDGVDGKDGISYWIEYDKKTNTLIFKNDGGKKSPDPIKLPPTAKGWGFAAGGGRGGVTAQSDWWQKDKHAVDYIKNKAQQDELPAAEKKYVGRIVQYTGEITEDYTHGFIYECKEKQINTITFDPNTISCSGDDFMAFVKSVSDDYDRVVSGTMTYLYDGDIWVFVGKDADGETVVTYQQYTGDFENAGFTFTGTFEDEDVVSFVRETETSYEWERIDVQPGGSGGGAVDDVKVNGASVVTDGVASIDLTDYQEKSNIQTLSATDSITLADNTIYNGGEQTALTIALPATDTIGFICDVDFSSGNTATTLSYSLPDIFWEGVDVAYDSTAQKNIFTPVANKRYTIIFYYDGVNYNGRVGGV